MRLMAISDLHLGNPTNRDAFADFPAAPEDWLIVAGDVAESLTRVEEALARLVAGWAKVIWVPGNHELWTLPSEAHGLRGVKRYRALVELARSVGALTPEDPYPIWEGAGGPAVVVPMFTLYDYSFAPDGLAPHEVPAWAAEEDIHPVDEALLHPDPHPSRAQWCAERVALTEARLEAIPADLPTVLVNHYPLIRDLARLPRVPRFAPWCGTRLTETWHRRFRALACVHGHLHIRGRKWRDGVPFEEVSLGYPRQWDQSLGMAGYLRPILPRPEL